MELKQQSVLQRLINTIQLNQQQLNFGSYAAELSFYIIWSIIPLILALANVVAVLPIDQADFINLIEMVLPDQVEPVIMPLFHSYLSQTSTGIFSISLIISLWPASNIFNTLQRVLNNIYKVEEPPNAIIGRIFAYIATVAAVIVGIALSFIIFFGEYFVNFIQEIFGIHLTVLDYLVQQSTLIGLIATFIALLLIYHFIPNVRSQLKYSLPGAIFSTLGFVLVSQLFTIYLSLTNRSTGNGAMGVFVIFVIWLYFNCMIIALGAYLNVFIYDYFEKSHLMTYKGVAGDTPKKIQSDDFNEDLRYKIHFVHEIHKAQPAEDQLFHLLEKSKGDDI